MPGLLRARLPHSSPSASLVVPSGRLSSPVHPRPGKLLPGPRAGSAHFGLCVPVRFIGRPLASGTAGQGSPHPRGRDCAAVWAVYLGCCSRLRPCRSLDASCNCRRESPIGTAGPGIPQASMRHARGRPIAVGAHLIRRRPRSSRARIDSSTVGDAASVSPRSGNARIGRRENPADAVEFAAQPDRGGAGPGGSDGHRRTGLWPVRHRTAGRTRPQARRRRIPHGRIRGDPGRGIRRSRSPVSAGHRARIDTVAATGVPGDTYGVPPRIRRQPIPNAFGARRTRYLNAATRSVGRPARDVDDLARDEARALAHQERGGVRDIVGVADALDRDLRCGGLLEVLEVHADA